MQLTKTGRTLFGVCTVLIGLLTLLRVIQKEQTTYTGAFDLLLGILMILCGLRIFSNGNNKD